MLLVFSLFASEAESTSYDDVVRCDVISCV